MNLHTSLVAGAKISEQAQRYEEMVKLMKKIVELGHDLNNEERNLLSVAYKHVSDLKRQSWRIICSLEHVAEMRNDSKLYLIKQYREKIESELEKLCLEIIELIDNYLLKVANQDEVLVFYHKMKADYYRYLCETVATPEKQKKMQSLSSTAYGTALGISEKLNVANPIRLGLVLNFAVFLFEVQKNVSQALLLAQTAFDQALVKVNNFQETAYKDSTYILQLLQNNIKMWSSIINDETFIFDETNFHLD